MTDIDYEKTFGFNPTSIGNRYRHHHLIDKPDYEDEQAGAKEGYLCVRARDGASNPIDPDACKHPNFVGTGEDDFDRTYRYYYYRPLTDADRVDPAALIASQAKRIAELEEGDEAEQLRETGWVIERGNSQPSTPTYWAGPDRWSQDHMDAVRFTRQIDAARVASRETWLAPHRVCEHVWISARATLKGET